MATPTVDLRQVSLLAEIVLRGGDFTDPRSRASLRLQYEQPNANYTDLSAGLSCLFRPGASLDELAREGSYPNARLSVAVVERLIQKLVAVERGLRSMSRQSHAFPIITRLWSCVTGYRRQSYMTRSLTRSFAQCLL